MHLSDLPDDILLCILNYGFGYSDAASFRLTCRSFFSLSLSRSFWLRIATTAEKIHPLPLPPFETLETLSEDRLRQVCALHARLERNFMSDRSDLPVAQETRVLELLGSPSEIYHFAFLPGGRFVLVLHLNGVFACWDTEVVRPHEGEGNSKGQIEERDGRGELEDDGGLEMMPKSRRQTPPPIVVGRLAATFDTQLRPISWNFQTFVGRKEVNVAVLSIHDAFQDDLGVPTHVKVLRLDFGDPLDVHVDCMAGADVHFPVARLYIQDDMVCVTGVLELALMLFLWNWRTGERVVINTGIVDEAWKYDVLPLGDQSILLYHEKGETGMAHLYDDVGTLMREASKMPFLAARGLKMRSRGPDANLEILFEGGGAIAGQRKWFTTHPWNTPNRSFKRPVSVLATCHAQGDGRTFRMLGHHWLDVDGLADKMRRSVEKEGPLVMERSLHRIDQPIREGFVGSELICPGSDGTHIVWLVNARETGPAIYMATMAPIRPGAMDWRVKRLNTGGWFDLKRVCSLDIDDAMGVFGFATYVQGAECQSIQLVYY